MNYTFTIPGHRPVYKQTPPTPIILIFQTHTLSRHECPPPTLPYPNPHPSLTLKHAFQLLARYSPTPASQFIYPAHSTQASAIVWQCLFILRVLLCVLPAHILIHSTQSSAKVCVLLHTSLLRVYQCRHLFLGLLLPSINSTSFTRHTNMGHRLVLTPPRS